MKAALIAGVASNGVIGFEGGMPWQLSTDLKRFKTITMGKPVIMGRNTYESIGKPLPGRLNLIVSRSGYKAEGVESFESIDQAVERAHHWALEQDKDELCIIGGGEIYRQTINSADRLYITHILAEPSGDTRFPEIDPDIWSEVSREVVPAGEKDSAETIFVIYERI